MKEEKTLKVGGITMSNQNPGCLGFIFKLLGLKPKHEPVEILPYVVRDDFVSPAELSFYKVLSQAISNEFIICPKVALKDIFFVASKDRGTFTSYSNKINLKHVDFLLCSKRDLRPICGIELDDSSHKKQDRIERDIFVDKVFKVAGLEIVRFQNRKTYSLQEVHEKLSLVSGNKSEIPLEIKQHSSAESETLIKQQEERLEGRAPVCKKCGTPMVLRTAKKGDNKGQEFYGCSNYPKCREVVEVK